MSNHREDSSYGQPPLWEKAGVCAALLSLPLLLGWTLVTSPVHRNNKHKHWRRIITDKTFHHVTESLNARQIQWLIGTSLDVYKAWTRRCNLPETVEELGQDGRLLWVGERRTDKVILLFHGGAFLLPLGPNTLSFWRYVKDELKRRDKDVGLAVLNYSLVPTKVFPAQLTQAVLAIRHLISAGLSPSNLQLVGDSAGGNLILQVISHVLHPHPSVPELSLSAPFAGAYLMSPWVELTSHTGSMVTNNDCDMVGTRGLLEFGKIILSNVPTSSLPYAEAAHAPEGWFADAQTRAASRILVTAGDKECLRDVIVNFGQVFCKAHLGARLVVQDYGVHDDPLCDFLLPKWEVADDDGKRKGYGKMKVVVGELTPLIVEFLDEGWR